MTGETINTAGFDVQLTLIRTQSAGKGPDLNTLPFSVTRVKDSGPTSDHARRGGVLGRRWNTTTNKMDTNNPRFEWINWSETASIPRGFLESRRLSRIKKGKTHKDDFEVCR